jgi:hypothetical protein
MKGIHVKQYVWYLQLLLTVGITGTGLGQKICPSNRPVLDEATNFIFHFDDSLVMESNKKDLPAVMGKVKFVPGRFGSAAVIGEGGIKLPKEYNSSFEVDRGSIEFFFKAENPEWFYESHSFLANNLNFCQAGNLALWYWADYQALRLDLHLPGDCGYIACGFPKDTKWHHIAATWNNQKGYTIYIDGVLATTRAITWPGMWISPDAPKIVIGESAGDCRIDEVRLSKTARTNPVEQGIRYVTIRETPRIENGRTMEALGLKFTNQSEETRSISADISLTDYFQLSCGQKTVKMTLKPRQTQNVLFDLPTDHAGPYLKISMKGVKESGAEKEEFTDEKLVFVDTLAGPRLRFDLNGSWEVCDGDPLKLTLPGSQATWKKIDLPNREWTWGKAHTKWFRKRIVLPNQMQGKTIELKLSGVRYRADVFVNGRSLGGYDTDQMPLTVDITDAAKVGAENELLLAVTDWLSCIPAELKPQHVPVSISNTGPGSRVFIRPHGSMVSPAGIIDPICLVATDKISIDDCYITPSVRKSNLTIKTIVNNRSGKVQKVRLDFSLFDKGSLVLETPKEAILKPGRNEITYVTPVDLTKLTLWQIAKPYLYQLRAKIQNGNQLLDQMDVRFGFREFWADGPIFRINGEPIKPVNAAGMPYQFPAFDSAVEGWNAIKRYLGSSFNAHINLIRFHSEPYPILFYDAADEVGLMIVSEAVMSTIPCAYNWGDERLWRVFEEYYPKWVYREFNHPCVVIRSMENELGYLLPKSGPSSAVGSEKVVKRTRDGMRALGRTVKRLDPSRPIMYDGSGPIFYEVADIYNLHYPGITGGGKLYPVSRQWITMPMPSYLLPKWTWDRKKPLYVGEADCCLAPTPAFLAAILGNDAYVDDWQTLAFEAIWPMSVENMRSDGITTVFPWNPLDPAVPVIDEKSPRIKLFKGLLTPIATFIRQYRGEYFGGRQVPRSMTTLNDSPSTKNITVKWRLALDNAAAIEQGDIAFALKPTESKRSIIRLALPKVTSPTHAKLIVETLADGKREHTTQREFEIFPDNLPKLNLSARYGLLGLESPVWSRLNVPVKMLDPKSLNLSDIDVLLVSGEIKQLKGQEAAIDAFIKNGGRIIVFQPAVSPGYLPIKVDMVKSEGSISYADDFEPGKRITIENIGSATTVVFPGFPEHPILKDLTKDRLRFWREDHITAGLTFVKPATIAARGLFDCGDGLKEAALLEIPHGKGLVLLNQMPVLELFDDQPAARILLGNLLRYVDAYRGMAPKPVGVLADRRSMTTLFLESLGLETFCLSGRLDKIKNFSAYGAIVLEADEKNLKELARYAEAIKKYVNAGGVVWIHRPKPEHTTVLNSLLPVPVEIKRLIPYSAIRIVNRDLASGITNESIFWPKGTPPWCGPVDARVATHRIVAAENKNVITLADPEVIVSMISGQGRWLIDEVAWENEFNERQRAETFVLPILCNLGSQIRKNPLEKKTADLGFHEIDISKFCNSPLLGGMWGGSEMGIKKLPVGLQTFKGFPYRLVDPASTGQKGCVSFYSIEHNPTGTKEITLPVDRKAAVLNLLITSLWTNTLDVMTPVLSVDIEYADGTKALTSVCFGRDVQDWCRVDQTPENHHPGVAWIGPEFPYPGLYQFPWENPNPEKVIRTVTLRAANPKGFAVLFAASTQDRLAGGQAERFVVPGTQ